MRAEWRGIGSILEREESTDRYIHPLINTYPHANLKLDHPGLISGEDEIDDGSSARGCGYVSKSECKQILLERRRMIHPSILFFSLLWFFSLLYSGFGAEDAE